MMLKKLFIVSLMVMGAFTAYGQPAFKGGKAALDNFLASKIIYPEYSKQNCISGTVRVSFRLDKNGRVYDARVSQGLGVDLDDEALRVIKLTSGKWVMPADYASDNIILPIRFQASQTICGSRNAADIALAINNYKIRQGLQDAFTHYYADKYLGKADTMQEPKIIKLKEQLGLNDQFINDLLDEAKEKLNQGDKDGACTDWIFIRNIGSNRADEFIAKYCK
jgi:TonB family protein